MYGIPTDYISKSVEEVICPVVLPVRICLIPSTERQLGPKERPADILRRRLEQAGYELKDNLQEIGNDDWRHLVLFVYKSQKLGVELEDTAGFEGTYDSYEIVNLSGRGLRTLPVLLYGQAEHIVVLNLSQNPMIDLPRDFIQSCGQLRDLKMSNMAIKKVPSSLRHCTPLSRLDLTCNRIRDLEDCGLENLPNLKALTLANNRLEQLPFIFPHLRALQTLNISNNRFRHVPAVVCEMPTLRDLDISFNSISALPEEIGQLVQLQQLVMVGNQVSEFPRECSGLVSLQVLDCRRNLLTDLSPVCQLPKLETLRADHNSIAELTLVLGPRLHILEVSWNDITRLAPPPADSPYSYSLTHLDLSHAKLSSLEESAFRSFTKLENLRLDHNALRTLPDSIGNLRRLMHLSCASNKLDLLPDSIGDLQKLETLDVNSNSIRELPASLWKCASIVSLNATSNLIEIWHEWEGTSSAPTSNGGTAASAQLSPGDADILRARKTSNAGLSMAGGRRERVVPPLGYSLERLYLGENQLGDDIVRLVASCFNELKIINLSFNDIQELPPLFFKQHPHLIELYLSGNKLSTIPSDTFDRAHYLTTLFLNGNRLQTIPAELGKIKTLTSLDVGSNQLKYNINNSEYDWNWCVAHENMMLFILIHLQGHESGASLSELVREQTPGDQS
jgi:adenylate cyclase